jgi:hypothetical protein
MDAFEDAVANGHGGNIAKLGNVRRCGNSGFVPVGALRECDRLPTLTELVVTSPSHLRIEGRVACRRLVLDTDRVPSRSTSSSGALVDVDEIVCRRGVPESDAADKPWFTVPAELAAAAGRGASLTLRLIADGLVVIDASDAGCSGGALVLALRQNAMRSRLRVCASRAAECDSAASASPLREWASKPQNATALTYLDLGEPHLNVSAADVEAIVPLCPSLTHVDLGNTLRTYTDATLRVIGQHCPRLSSLILRKASTFTDIGLSCIAVGCPSLRTLDVRDTAGRITDAGVCAIAARCSTLTHLDVSYTRGKVTDAGLAAIAAGCPALESLAASWVENRFSELADFSASSASLSASFCAAPLSQGITDVGIRSVALRCPRLTHLDVSRTHGAITDASIELIAENCPRLTHLDLSASDGKVTDSAVIAIAKRCTRLAHLNVAQTGGSVTDAGVAAVAVACRQLRYLNVNDAEGAVTDVGIRAVVTNCPGLRQLHVLWSNDRITNKSINLIRRSQPRAIISDLSHVESVY